MAIVSLKKVTRYTALGVAAVMAALGVRSYVAGTQSEDLELAMQAGFLGNAAPVTVSRISSYVAPSTPRGGQPGEAGLTGPETGYPDEPATPNLSPPRIATVPEDLGRHEYLTEAEAQAAITAARIVDEPREAEPAARRVTPRPRPTTQVTRAAASPALQALAVPMRPAQPDAAVDKNPSCTPDFNANSIPGGMASVVVDAPCHSGHSLILGHAGLAVDAEVPDDGRLVLTVPVLDNRQPFTMTLDDGLSAQAPVAGVPAVEFDHIVLQWQGDAGFQLHAREFGADYGDAGHVWAGRPRTPAAGEPGQVGFLTRLGDPAVGGVADVYSYPVGQVQGDDAVALTIEAEVTAKNCGADITGQVLQRTADGTIISTDVTFAVPDCDAQGEILVLKIILQGLKIAAN